MNNNITFGVQLTTFITLLLTRAIPNTYLIILIYIIMITNMPPIAVRKVRR